MRKMFFALWMCLLITSSSFAQGILGQWKISKIGIAHGNEQDMIKGLDYKFFAEQVPEDVDWYLRDASFASSDYYSSVCENPELTLSMTLSNPRFEKWEWRNDLRYKYNRVDYISYYSQPNDFGGGRGNYVSFDGRHNELALESSIGRVMTIVNGLNLTPSIGGNVGYTGKNTLCVTEVVDIDASDLKDGADGLVAIPDSYTPIDECFDTGSVMNYRVFLELKGSLVVKKRAELFLSVRKGLGYRVGNGHSAATQGNMVNIGFNWMLKRKADDASL